MCYLQVNSTLKENGIEVRDYTTVSSDVILLASNKLDSSSTVNDQGNGREEGNNNDSIWVDSGSCCYALYSKLNADKVIQQQSPVALPKALKVMLHIKSINNFQAM